MNETRVNSRVFYRIGFPVSNPSGIPRVSGRYHSCQEAKMGAAGSCGSGKSTKKALSLNQNIFY